MQPTYCCDLFRDLADCEALTFVDAGEIVGWFLYYRDRDNQPVRINIDYCPFCQSIPLYPPEYYLTH